MSTYAEASNNSHIITLPPTPPPSMTDPTVQYLLYFRYIDYIIVKQLGDCSGFCYSLFCLFLFSCETNIGVFYLFVVQGNSTYEGSFALWNHPFHFLGCSSGNYNGLLDQFK